MPELPDGYQHLDGSERHAASNARLVGPADPAEVLSVTIHLRRRPGAPELPDQQYWADTPPDERTYLSRADFAGTYGASPDDVDSVSAFAREHGLEVQETDLAQRIIRVSGTTAQVNQAFGVELGTTRRQPGATAAGRATSACRPGWPRSSRASSVWTTGR
jgi:kumamolisin